MKLSEELKWRGFVNQTTLSDISELDKDTKTFYFGVDPSSNAMTVGNLASAMMVRCFIKHGYKGILLVGGATGLIGDPDGKSEERTLKTAEEVKENVAGITKDYQKIFKDIQEVEIVDNYDWFKDLGYLEFLRDIGKHFSMTQLLDRDFVQSRIGEGGKGISYAEFSYSLIQGYDFLHLNRTKGATLQLAGADQWGNSLSGVELIRKLESQSVHVWTCPLVMNTTTGKKFGKSEEGAVWLNPDKTSVFDFYQFWLNTDDAGAEQYLKIYTLLDKEEIDQTIQEFQKDPSTRSAQKKLAFEVTKLVHGEQQAQQAKEATESLAKGEASESMPTHQVESENQDLRSLLVDSGLASSRSQADRLIEQGGVKINRQKASENQVNIQDGDILQVGKRNFIRLIVG